MDLRLEEGLRDTIALALGGGVTIALTWLVLNGFTLPPHSIVERMGVVLLAAILIGFPASVVSIRLGVRKANRTRVG